MLIEEGIAASVGARDDEAASYERMGRLADVAVVLGGDGTMLYAARRLAEFGVPLVGCQSGPARFHDRHRP